MQLEPSRTRAYPGVELHEIGVDGTTGAPALERVRETEESHGRKNTSDLVIVSMALSSSLAQSAALRIAQQKKQQQALFVAVCDVADEASAAPAAPLQALCAAYDAVLVVTASQRQQRIDRLIRTIATPEEPDQWLACDWSDIRHIFQAAATGPVRYGSGRRVGPGCAAAAAADAIKEIESAGPEWRTAYGICVGIQSSSKDMYGRAIKDVLAHVCAGFDAGVMITLSAGHNGKLEPGAVEVNLFAFGQRRTAQAATADGSESRAYAIDDTLDPLYPHARSLVLQHRRASISLVQRHLRIGYRRACQLVEAMEGDVLSAEDANGLRQVLLPAAPTGT